MFELEQLAQKIRDFAKKLVTLAADSIPTVAIINDFKQLLDDINIRYSLQLEQLSAFNKIRALITDSRESCPTYLGYLVEINGDMGELTFMLSLIPQREIRSSILNSANALNKCIENYQQAINFDHTPVAMRLSGSAVKA